MSDRRKAGQQLPLYPMHDKERAGHERWPYSRRGIQRTPPQLLRPVSEQKLLEAVKVRGEYTGRALMKIHGMLNEMADRTEDRVLFFNEMLKHLDLGYPNTDLPLLRAFRREFQPLMKGRKKLSAKEIVQTIDLIFKMAKEQRVSNSYGEGYAERLDFEEVVPDQDTYGDD